MAKAKLVTDRASRELLEFGLTYPNSSATVVNLPFAKPTGYGLGKAGWVTVEFADEVPVEMLEELIDESDRAVAETWLHHQLDARLAPAGRSKHAAKARVSASKPAARIQQAGARVATAKPKARAT